MFGMVNTPSQVGMMKVPNFPQDSHSCSSSSSTFLFPLHSNREDYLSDSWKFSFHSFGFMIAPWTYYPKQRDFSVQSIEVYANNVELATNKKPWSNLSKALGSIKYLYCVFYIGECCSFFYFFLFIVDI